MVTWNLAAGLPARFTRSQDHHEAYLPLIQWELDDELDATDERLRNWSRAKLAAHGLALFDLRARPDGWLFGQRIVKLELDGRADMGQHRFRQGDIVMLSRGDPIGEKPIEAIVSDRSRNRIRIVMPELPSGVRSGYWRIDRAANKVAFDRMRDALNSIFEEEGGAPLRDLLLGLVHDPVGTAGLGPELVEQIEGLRADLKGLTNHKSGLRSRNIPAINLNSRSPWYRENPHRSTNSTILVKSKRGDHSSRR